MASITALTGWRGVIVPTDGAVGPIRFTSESIDVPLAEEVNDSIHAGVRTSSVFTFGLVKPAGDIAFPLLSEDLSTTVESSVALSTQAKLLLTRAVQPYSAGTSATLPVLDDTSIIIYRGDSKKTIYNPWINTLNMSGDAGQAINITLGIKAIAGKIEVDTNTPDTLNVKFNKARSITFNELSWDNFNTSVTNSLVASLGSSVSLTNDIRPRRFTFNVENGLQDDDTPNNDIAGITDRIVRIRAIRGFALGYQRATFTATFIGAILPAVGGTVKQYSLPITPGGNGIDIGGLYNIVSGLVTVRQIPMPGTEEIATTEITIKGMLASNDGTNYLVTPGTLVTS